MDVQRQAPAALPPGKRPGAVGRLDPRAGLEGGVKTRPHRIRSPDRSVRRRSLYWYAIPARYADVYKRTSYDRNVLLIEVCDIFQPHCFLFGLYIVGIGTVFLKNCEKQGRKFNYFNIKYICGYPPYLQTVSCKSILRKLQVC